MLLKHLGGEDRNGGLAMGFFDFLRDGADGSRSGSLGGRNAMVFDDAGATSVVGFGNSFTAFGPQGMMSGFAHLDDEGNGTMNALGPDGISTTFACGGCATTFGPDGKLSTTLRCGNMFTTLGPDGQIHTMYRNGNTFTTFD